MPLVSCYEHPRKSRYYYGIDQKLLYVQDLKVEAFDNLREKFFEFREPEVKKLTELFEPKSVLDFISLINMYKRDSFKSFGANLHALDFIEAWRSYMFGQDLTIYDHLAGVGVANKHNRDKTFADVSVEIEDMGFMWPLFGKGQLESHMFTKDTSIIICPPPSSEAFSTCGKLLIRTYNPYVISWASDVVDYLNNYRELEGLKPSYFFESSDFIETYGKIRIY